MTTKTHPVEQVSERARALVAELLGYRDWDDATDYRTTGEQDRQRDRALALVAVFERDILAGQSVGEARLIPGDVPPFLSAPEFDDHSEERVCINGCLYLRADFASRGSATPASDSAEQHPLARMVALDEEIEAEHPGWMTGEASDCPAMADDYDTCPACGALPCDWTDNPREFVDKFAKPTTANHTAPDALRDALKLAIMHIEHMGRWLGDLQLSGKSAGYSFEALGEDLPGIKTALASTTPDPAGRVEKLEEALRQCQKRFQEYTFLHLKKAQEAKTSTEHAARNDKADRNHEMVKLIESALNGGSDAAE